MSLAAVEVVLMNAYFNTKQLFSWSKGNTVEQLHIKYKIMPCFSLTDSYVNFWIHHIFYFSLLLDYELG